MSQIAVPEFPEMLRQCGIGGTAARLCRDNCGGCGIAMRRTNVGPAAASAAWPRAAPAA
jgi:hypothetical protein